MICQTFLKVTRPLHPASAAATLGCGLEKLEMVHDVQLLRVLKKRIVLAASIFKKLGGQLTDLDQFSQDVLRGMLQRRTRWVYVDSNLERGAVATRTPRVLDDALATPADTRAVVGGIGLVRAGFAAVAAVEDGCCCRLQWRSSCWSSPWWEHWLG